MEVSYKRDMNHTYLILQGGEKVDTSAYPVRMMLSNQWETFLPCTIQGMDNQVFFYYDITSRQSLSSLYETGKADYRKLRGLVEGIVSGLDEAEEYLLDSSCILLEPEYIYWDGQRGKFQFCYFPDTKEGGKIKDLTEYLLPRIDHRDQEAVVLGYGMYRKAMEENFQGKQLRELLYRKEENAESGGEEKEAERISEEEREEEEFDWWEEKPEEEKRGGLAETALLGCIAAGSLLLISLWVFFCRWKQLQGWFLWMPCVLVGTAGITGAGVLWKRRKEEREEREIREVMEQTAARRKAAGQRKERIKEKNAEQETIPEREEGADTCLLCEQVPQAQLIPVTEGKLENLILDRDQMLIGKLEGAADLQINVPTVSRLHARIEKREGEYYLQDMNSKNGTRVNHRELAGGEKCMLKNGDLVSFADISYHFRV